MYEFSLVVTRGAKLEAPRPIAVLWRLRAAYEGVGSKDVLSYAEASLARFVLGHQAKNSELKINERPQPLTAAVFSFSFCSQIVVSSIISYRNRTNQTETLPARQGNRVKEHKLNIPESNVGERIVLDSRRWTSPQPPQLERHVQRRKASSEAGTRQHVAVPNQAVCVNLIFTRLP
jgi:hypothetical protein